MSLGPFIWQSLPARAEDTPGRVRMLPAGGGAPSAAAECRRSGCSAGDRP